MNRATIAAVGKLCAEVRTLCDAATEQLDAEMYHHNVWRESPGAPLKPSASDHSYGSKATGALRRRSLDLTRALADMRRPS